MRRLLLVLLLSGCAAQAQPAAVDSGLLQAAPHGDGDSWKDTRGHEYRLGMVNTPELSECYGNQARAHRQQLTAGGFRARVYTTDRYGREVAVVTSPTAATSTSCSPARGTPTTGTWRTSARRSRRWPGSSTSPSPRPSGSGPACGGPAP